MPDHAQNNSERLEVFRQELDRHRVMTRQGLDRVHGGLSRLSQRWSDEQFNRFRQSFHRTTDELQQFLEHTGRQVVHLEDLVKASRLIESGELGGR
jgi:hypothetical protein